MPFHRLYPVNLDVITPLDSNCEKFRQLQSDVPEKIIFRFIWISRLGPETHPALTSQCGFFSVHGDYDMSHGFFYTIKRDFIDCDWDPKFLDEHFKTIINEDDGCYDIEYTHSRAHGYKAIFTFVDADRVYQFRDWLKDQLGACIPMTPKNAAT